MPYDLALQSGGLWVSYGAVTNGTLAGGTGAIGVIDPSSGAFTAAAAGPGDFWYSAPDLAADPSDTGVVVAVQTDIDPVATATFNTTKVPATPIAGPGYLGGETGCTTYYDLAVVPGGGTFIAGCYSPYNAEVYATTDLASPTGSYATSGPAGAIAVAIAPSGDIAVATETDAYVYKPDGTLLDTYGIGDGPSLAPGGLAWSADGSTLYAVTESNSGAYSAGPATGVLVQTSSITLGTPAFGLHGYDTVTIPGVLAFASGPPAEGTPINITMDGPGNSVTATSVQTDNASGAFTITETPSAVGTYTVTAGYGGAAHVANSQASTTFAVNQLPSQVGLSAPSGDFLGVRNTFSGTLRFAGVTPPAGTPVTVTRADVAGFIPRPSR